MKRVLLLAATAGIISAGCLEIHIHPTFVVPGGAPGSPTVPTYVSTSQQPLGLRANPYDAVPVAPARPNWQMRPIDTAWPAPPPSAVPTEGPKLRNIAGCDPPYTITSTGFRRIKLECLE